MKIIEDISRGNLYFRSLAEHLHSNCKKPKEEIARALHGNIREDYLFDLKQEFECYTFYQIKIKACDKKIESNIKKELKRCPERKTLKTTDKPYKRINKNAPQIKDLNQMAFRYFGGVDLFAIEGMSYSTILSIMSEIEPEGFN